jgi:hypothetical protein
LIGDWLIGGWLVKFRYKMMDSETNYLIFGLHETNYQLTNSKNSAKLLQKTVENYFFCTTFVLKIK